MINPYEPTVSTPSTEQRTWRGIAIVVAALIGYVAPLLVVALWSWFLYDRTVAMENFGRVRQMHQELSLNSLLAFIPGLFLALIFATAAHNWASSRAPHRRWWILGLITLVGYFLVLDSTARWNLIPWTWPSELQNVPRTLLTLAFPAVAYVIAMYRSRRSQQSFGRDAPDVATEEPTSRPL